MTPLSNDSSSAVFPKTRHPLTGRISTGNFSTGDKRSFEKLRKARKGIASYLLNPQSEIRRADDEKDFPAGIKVNGQPAPLTVAKGYVTLTRTWQAGDVIDARGQVRQEVGQLHAAFAVFREPPRAAHEPGAFLLDEGEATAYADRSGSGTLSVEEERRHARE
jgi:hypothetical protein